MNVPDFQQVLRQAREGDSTALDRLFHDLRSDLRRIIQRSRSQRRGLSLRTTEVFNESFLKLFGGRVPDLADRVWVPKTP